jgi:hypothetical protein
MLRLTSALLAALTLALTACNSNEESLSDTTPSPTATETTGDITICIEIGVPGEATPSSPTPEPSCEPGDDFPQIAPGIRGTLADPPPLPSGMTALTRYIEFEIDEPGTNADVGLALTAEAPIGDSFAWYTYDSGQWRELDTTVQIHASTISGEDAMAVGDFQPLPANLILLAEQ